MQTHAEKGGFRNGEQKRIIKTDYPRALKPSQKLPDLIVLLAMFLSEISCVRNEDEDIKCGEIEL